MKNYVNDTTCLTNVKLHMRSIWGSPRTQENVEVSVTVIINGSKGSFEIYDTETSGENWYVSGSLCFKGNRLTGYDGMSSLSDLVIEEIELRGYEIDL